MDVRGLTLRRKNKSSARPQISAPKPVDASGFSGNNQQSATPSSQRVQVDKKHQKNKGAISDLVKRRYSTRFYQPGQEATQGAPPVPQIPTSRESPPASRTSPHHHTPHPHPAAPAAKEQPLGDPKQLVRVDEKVLANPDLQADKCRYPSYHIPYTDLATEMFSLLMLRELKQKTNRCCQFIGERFRQGY